MEVLLFILLFVGLGIGFVVDQGPTTIILSGMLGVIIYIGILLMRIWFALDHFVYGKQDVE